MKFGCDFAIRAGLLLVVGVYGCQQAQAQSDATRAEISNSVNTLAPNCAAFRPPSSGASLDEQMRAWEEMETCLTAAAAITRTSAFTGDEKDQRRALLQAPVEQKALAQIEAAKREIQNQKDFLGFSWGLGFGFGWSDDDRIEQAQLINNVVRATKDASEQARVFFEYHWFPESWQDTLGAKDSGAFTRAQGPFIAVSSRDDKVLSGVGAGWMVGFREKSKSDGFGVALGAILDNDVTSLADGFEDGQPAPNGETQIRTESKSEVSYVLFFTRSF